MSPMNETFALDASESSVTLEDWLEALGQLGRALQADFPSLPVEEVAALTEDLRDWLRWRLPAEAPASFEEQAAWLGRIETLDLALRGARALGDSVPWAADLARFLDESLSERESAVARMPRPWWHARTAVAQRDDLALPDARPWCWLPSLESRGGLDLVGEEDRLDVIRAWAAGALPGDDEAALRQAVTAHPDWKRTYRGWLQEHLDEVWIEPRQVALETPRQLTIFRLPLPHLGRGLELRVCLTEQGTRWEFPGYDALVPLTTSSLQLPLGAVGEFSVRLHEQALDEEQQAARVLLTSRHFLDELEDTEALTMALRLTGWFQEQLPHLASAARAFREDDEAACDDFWPRHLVELRVRLEQAAVVLGNEQVLGSAAEPLLRALRELDRSAAPHREALGLLEDEFFLELDQRFGASPPGTWWAPLEEPPFILPPRRRIFPPVRPPLRLQAAAFGEQKNVPEERLLRWRSPDGWEADLNLPGEASDNTVLVIRFFDLPDEATHAVLAGLELPISRSQDDAPQASCTAEDLRMATLDKEFWADSIQVKVGEKISTGDRVE